MTPVKPAATAEAPFVLRLDGITKRFGALLANDAISLELRRGEVLALLGENGAGKTTLMSILFGHYVADAGSIEAFGQTLPPGSPRAAIDVGIGMVHQHFTLGDNMTVLENIVLGAEPLFALRQNHKAARARLAQLADRFGLAVRADARIQELSVGERQRVEILKALYRNARVLILDEPTAVLTPQESATLFETLHQMVADGLSVIFISHKLNEVMEIADRVTVLRRGKVVANFRKSETSREALAAAMVGREVAQPKRQAMAAGKTVLRLAGVSVAAAEAQPALRSVDLELREHEILGIAGVSGNGQGSLAALMSGLAVAASGSLELLGRPVTRAEPAAMVASGVGRVPEDRHRFGVVGDMTPEENLILEDYRSARFQRFGIFRFRAIAEHAKALIRGYDIRGADEAALARSLSGGNMQKLILARVLSREPAVILANQPTRGLDVGAAAYVHEQLFAARARGAGVILITEDLDELLAISDRVAVMYQGTLSASRPVEGLGLTELGLMMSGAAAQGGAGHAA
ncbi:ABC transporter ATP-binding protein [Oceanibacterium hippocampi]|nr:ABC transporter ATP-binding protein [Oceanibacterium hippocampi]